MRSSFVRLLVALPLVLASVGLLDNAASLRLLPPLYEETLLAVVLVPLVSWLVALRRCERHRAWRTGAIAACAVAPLAVLGSWALMPGGIYGGAASFRTFLHWSTRYPNVGPINYEVVAGLCCVLGASFLPWVFANYLLRAAPPARRTLGILLACQWLAYLPLLWALDVWQLLIGGHWLIEGAPGMGAVFLSGALPRLTATISMSLLFARAQRSQ